jgi:thiosulfate dehydrogenase
MMAWKAMTPRIGLLRLLTLAAALALASPSPGQAQGVTEGDLEQFYSYGTPQQPSETWRLAFGGRIYDHWMETLHRDAPDAEHPGYPRGGPAEDGATWRCVSCHGWNHDGVAGAGGGIRQMASATPEAIVAVIRDGRHGYTPDMIPDAAAEALALYVAKGQDNAAPVDEVTGAVEGNLDHGRAIYQNLCAICHQFDGRAQIVGEPGDEPILGWVAANKPWQALHKIRNGQPGADMPAMRAFDLATAIDLLAYLQTLPRE